MSLSRQAINPDTEDQSWPIAAQALIDSLMRENADLRARLEVAEQNASCDVLTPTLNRRAFVQELNRAMSDCRRYTEEAALIFLDLDGFKSINDIYGHAAGDAALVYVAETLKANVREGDSVGRIGGDEFAVLLRRAGAEAARAKAHKLQAELEVGAFAYGALYLKTGGSFGVRAFEAQTSAEEWLAEADAAMFLAKKQGTVT